MISTLRKHDPNLAEMSGKDGTILVSPELQGRIFCTLGSELMHRLDVDLLDCPLETEFNNLGGNSLWPAPEGGDFAFNYGPGSDEWLVQDGIATAPANVTSLDATRTEIGKQIQLTNRKGVTISLRYDRQIELTETAMPTSLQAIAYRCTDTFEPMGAYPTDDMLLAPWSLEQFSGGEGVTAFAKVSTPETSINFDFYGMPEVPPLYKADHFELTLGGKARFQIGIKVDNAPKLIGALDRKRSILILRQTSQQPGRYFNIADNDQPQGPNSAADLYSVFNGGDLNFFELETIAPMQSQDGMLATSTLVSETKILTGPLQDLKQFLRETTGIIMEDKS